MITILCLIIFAVVTLYQVRYAAGGNLTVRLPQDRNKVMLFTGQEALIICIFATAWLGLTPVIAIRVIVIEALCIFALLQSTNRLPWSFPLKFYLVFVAWLVIGLFYTPSLSFGLRMIIKYMYPFILALLCTKVVRDGETALTASLISRRVATIGVLCILIPGYLQLISYILYPIAGYITGIISMAILSFALVEFSNNKKRNLLWGIGLCLPALIKVYRTDIFGTGVALAAFFTIKYKLKALPIVGLIGVAGICVMFFVPSVREKMFINQDVTITDFMEGGKKVDESTIQTNYRAYMWKMAKKDLIDGHELIGAGTGRVQKYMYTEVDDNRRGGQLHNDFLVLQIDNGLIGLYIYILCYIFIFLHCLKIYHTKTGPYTRMFALTAGASILGVLVTMYSDNTISYSIVTTSFPWAFYGMALGLKESRT